MTQTSQGSGISTDITTMDLADPDPYPRHPSAKIDLSRIGKNYQHLNRFASSAEVGAVVKANAYGHGASEVAFALSKHGCQTFFVAYLDEGVELRARLGSGPAIYVFHGVIEAEIPLAIRSALRPVFNRMLDIAAWVQSVPDAPYAIHFDTGMNRLGLRSGDLFEARTLTGMSPPELVLSHLACADVPRHPINDQQLEKFRNVADAFPRSKRSLAATAGLYLGREYHFDIARPGIGLYGGGPTPPELVDLVPALTLTAPILTVFETEPGETSGYGATVQFDSHRRLATVSMGYADGFLRAGSNAGYGILHGCECPVVGRVSMDLLTLDITGVRSPVHVGDVIEFLGPQAGLERQAKALETLGYELTSRLGHRISRTWIN